MNESFRNDALFFGTKSEDNEGVREHTNDQLKICVLRPMLVEKMKNDWSLSAL